MYRLMIVDDERIARVSVESLLATQTEWELEVVSVDSAVKAVPLLETDRFDLVIMDINMPQMTGLELYDIVQENWPQCKVIFLTGYSEFDYVYKVHKHAKYVLKADRDEVLLEAIRESIQEIENEMLIARISDMDPEFKQQDGNLRAGNFLRELIEGYTEIGIVTDDILQDMNISLKLRQKTYAILLRCEAIGQAPFEKRQLINDQISLLLRRYFYRESHCALVVYKNMYFYLLLQPKTDREEESMIKRLFNLCSLFQSALQMNAHVSAAILIPGRAMSFQASIQSFSLFYDELAAVETADTQIYYERTHAGVGEGSVSETNKMRTLQAAIKLDYLFEGGNRQEVLSTINRIREAAKDVSSMHDLFLLEVYYRVAVELLKLIKQHEVSERQAFQLGLMDIFDSSVHKNWNQAFLYLADVASRIFDFHQRERMEKQENLVTRIKEYIHENLSRDTSLTAISDHFHFSQEYLLRLFKKEEGVTILQYINDLKLKRAKELLRNPDLQVRDVAELLGYHDNGYFIRFFRSKTGMSPKVYREQGRSQPENSENNKRKEEKA